MGGDLNGDGARCRCHRVDGDRDHHRRHGVDRVVPASPAGLNDGDHIKDPTWTTI